MLFETFNIYILYSLCPRFYESVERMNKLYALNNWLGDNNIFVENAYVMNLCSSIELVKALD